MIPKILDKWPTLRPNRALRLFVLKTLRALPPDKVLRFLFRVEYWLEYFESQVAVTYEGGVHPKHRHMRYHDFFVERIKADERVLDIGCGIGAVAYDVAEKAGAHVMAIDLNPDHIAQAQQRYPHPRIEYVVGDVLQALPNSSFDVVILSNVLEHLPERAAFLRKVQQVANSSRFLIRVPLFERDWRVPLKKELGVEWRSDPTHETEYTLESFADEMTAAKLRIHYQEVRWGEIWAEMIPI